MDKSSTTADEPFFHLSNVEKEHFLLLFIEDMTIEMRDTYLLETEAAGAKFKSWNELLHRIASTVRALHERDDKRFPDDVLFGMLRSEAALRPQIETALRNAYRFLKKDTTAKHRRKIAATH